MERFARDMGAECQVDRIFDRIEGAGSDFLTSIKGLVPALLLYQFKGGKYVNLCRKRLGFTPNASPDAHRHSSTVTISTYAAI